MERIVLFTRSAVLASIALFITYYVLMSLAILIISSNLITYINIENLENYLILWRNQDIFYSMYSELKLSELKDYIVEIGIVFILFQLILIQERQDEQLPKKIINKDRKHLLKGSFLKIKTERKGKV